MFGIFCILFLCFISVLSSFLFSVTVFQISLLFLSYFGFLVVFCQTHNFVTEVTFIFFYFFVSVFTVVRKLQKALLSYVLILCLILWFFCRNALIYKCHIYIIAVVYLFFKLLARYCKDKKDLQHSTLDVYKEISFPRQVQVRFLKHCCFSLKVPLFLLTKSKQSLFSKVNFGNCIFFFHTNCAQRRLYGRSL